MLQVFSKIRSWHPSPGVLRLLAYGIPLLALAVVLYLNFLPFGYDRTFVLTPGQPGDTRGEFRIERYLGLSGRTTGEDGVTYRTLEGAAFLVFDPNAFLRNARATVRTDTQGVVLLPPNIAWDADSAAWEYRLPADALPAGCIAFDGATQLPLPGLATAQGYGEEAFSVYASWTPEDDNDGFQQIAGRYGWELLQNKDDVKFQVGSTSVKVENRGGHFGSRHEALATYVPPSASGAGYIELYVDGHLAGRAYTAEVADVAGRPITLGKSDYAEASYFRGCIHDVRLDGPLDFSGNEVSFRVTRARGEYPIAVVNLSGAPVRLGAFQLHVVQD